MRKLLLACPLVCSWVRAAQKVGLYIDGRDDRGLCLWAMGLREMDFYLPFHGGVLSRRVPTECAHKGCTRAI